MSEKKKVVVVGGTGYLGQHLLQSFSDENRQTNPCDYEIAFTYHSNPPPKTLLDSIPHSSAFPVDLRSGHGFHAISQTFGQVSYYYALSISLIAYFACGYYMR